MDEGTALATELPQVENWSAEQVLGWAFEQFGSSFAIASAFGVEGMVLIDLASRLRPNFRVFTLDTGFFFPETYALISQVERRYGITVESVRPALTPEEQALMFGEALWSRDPQRCCGLRKLDPLGRKLSELEAWATAIRRDQTAARTGTSKVEWDSRFGLVKINPLADWKWDEVWDYVRANRVPYNPLHDRNYPSIGCTQCTRAVAPGEDLRAGRWPGFEKTECGLHSAVPERDRVPISAVRTGAASVDRALDRKAAAPRRPAALFPLFLKLTGRACLVVGAGREGESKIASLLAAGADVRVIAPEATAAIEAWARQGRLQWTPRRLEAIDLDGVFLAVVATSDRELNQRVYQEAERRGILCNVADDPPHCDFYYPSVVRRGALQIAISTDGRSPALAQRLRRELEQQFGPEYEPWIDELGRERRGLFQQPMDPELRRRRLHELASRESFEKFVRNRTDAGETSEERAGGDELRRSHER